MPFDGFDFLTPNYVKVFQERALRLIRIRADIKQKGSMLRELLAYYKDNIADFITDWGVTFDPRNVGTDKPAYLPFILFERQREWVSWVLERWRRREPGINDKSRDMGMSWLSVSTSSSLCLFNENMAIGFGSRKEEYVDKLGDPKCLFWKARMFLENLPPEFTGSWDRTRDAPHMRINFPDTNSFITGESGDNIGRGDRTSIHFVDESAYLERPHMIEASLSQTTNCRIDISSANGMGNPFAEKRHKWDGTPRVFTVHWSSDPRKSNDIKDEDGLCWYERQVRDLDPVVLAQEVDINYQASVEGIVIPSVWVNACVDAHKVLGFEPTGAKFGSLDVADEGKDKNAFVGAHGVVVQRVEEWSGKNSDIAHTTTRAFALCDELGYSTLTYDADGIGAGVRAAGRLINEKRNEEKLRTITLEPFRASESVLHPDREDVPGRLNQDYFDRRKAQAMWALRIRFEKTYRAVIEKDDSYAPDELISLDKDALGAELLPLIRELSQPTYTRSTTGKITINKKPVGMLSPNRADALMQRFGVVLEDGGFFDEGQLTSGMDAVDMPTMCDVVFATVFVTNRPGKDEDSVGVVYWSRSQHTGHPLIALDWDISELDGNLLTKWVPNIYTRLTKLAKSAGAVGGALGVYVEDKSTGSVLIRQAAQMGHPMAPIDPALSVIEPVDRALNASRYVNSGMVKVGMTGHTRTRMFKGANRNHFIGQIAAFRAGSKDASASALLNCFTHGVALALDTGR